MTATLSWIDEITMSQLERNPYPIYERLRAESPLAYLPVLGSYVATTTDICREIATSDDFEAVITKAGGRTFGHPAVIGVNGPIHEDLRSMVDPALQPQEVDRWIDDLVRPIARRFLETFEDDGNVELVSQYCEPVSVRALGDLLGLADVDSDTLRDWFHKLSRSFTNAGVDENGEFTNPDGFREGDEAKAEIRAIVDPKIDHWIEHPDDTAISHWLHDGMPAGQTRDREYIYPTLYVYLLGAMQEPGHAMASTLVGLFTRPDQMEQVVDEPQLIPRAISEACGGPRRSGRRPPASPPPTSRWPGWPCPRAPWCCCLTARPTTTPPPTPRRRSTTSPGRRCRIWPSVRASTRAPGSTSPITCAGSAWRSCSTRSRASSAI